MSAWLIVLGYGAAWLTSAVWVSRRLTMISRCHGESRRGGGYNWGYTEHDCRGHCKPGCWRPNEVPSFGQFAGALAACLLWPLAVPAALAYTLAIASPPPAVNRSDEIARLEREVFGREQP